MDSIEQKEGKKTGEIESIKEAVGGSENMMPAIPPSPNAPSPLPSYGKQFNEEYETPSGYEGMQPSIFAQQQTTEIAGPESSMLTGQQQTEPSNIQQQEGVYPPDLTQQGGGVVDYNQYAQYQPYQEAMSSDVITEISEQVVTEKLAGLHDRLEKVLDFKTTIESRVENIEERLKRIESIIDKLQLAVLQRVGAYIEDVSDIKTELEEMQKSFKKLLPAFSAKIPEQKNKEKIIP